MDLGLSITLHSLLCSSIATWQVLFSIPPSLSIIFVYINALLGRYILLAVIEGTAHVTRHGITARVALRLTSHGASLEQPVRFPAGRELGVRPLLLTTPVARRVETKMLLRRRGEHRREGVLGGERLRRHGQFPISLFVSDGVGRAIERCWGRMKSEAASFFCFWSSLVFWWWS